MIILYSKFMCLFVDSGFLVSHRKLRKPRHFYGLSPLGRDGNRAGWANSGPDQNRAGPKLARFFRAKILTAQPALKTGSVGPNSLFKAKKNSGGQGRAIPGRAKFGPIFFGPII